MIQAKEILNYIVETKAMLQNKYNIEATSDDEKKFYQDQIDAFTNIESWTVWRLKSPDEKQVTRLQQLATMRKIDALPKKVKNQELLINFYDIFRKTNICICALDKATLNDLKIFCEVQLDKIDFKPRDFIEMFLSSIEIEQIFKAYFEITKPAKGNGNMFDECYEKIELLYNELMKLTEETT